jgi:tetratricopeptide (TPR) repeat protein
MKNQRPELLGLRKSGSFNWWVALGLVVVTVAVAAILWQIISSLEGNSVQVHEYINKSKEDEHDANHMLKDAMPEEAPVGITLGKFPTLISGSMSHFQAGLNSTEKHDDTQAIAEFSQALAVSLQDKSGMAYFTKGDALSGPGFQALAYNSRAFCYRRQKKYAEAIKDLSEAIKLKPTPSYYSQRAELYLLLHKPDQAAADQESEQRLTNEIELGHAAASP